MENRGYIAHLITNQGSDGKLRTAKRWIPAGLSANRGGTGEIPVCMGGVLIFTYRQYRQESIGFIHSVGKLEVKGWRCQGNCNVVPQVPQQSRAPQAHTQPACPCLSS